METFQERLRVAYTAVDEDVVREVELPFIVGVMANLSGDCDRDEAAIDRQSFEEVPRDLDELLRAKCPRLLLDVPGTRSSEGLLAVDLSFESFEDFTPAGVRRRLEALRPRQESDSKLDPLSQRSSI